MVRIFSTPWRKVRPTYEILQGVSLDLQGTQEQASGRREEKEESMQEPGTLLP